MQSVVLIGATQGTGRELAAELSEDVPGTVTGLPTWSRASELVVTKAVGYPVTVVEPRYGVSFAMPPNSTTEPSCVSRGASALTGHQV